MLNHAPEVIEKRDDVQVLLDADYLLYLVGAVSQHKAPVPKNEGQEVRQNSAGDSYWVDGWGLVQWRIENELDRISDALRIDRSCFEYFLTDNSNGSFRHALAVTKPYKGQRCQPRPILYYEIRKYLVDTYGARVATYCEADDFVATAQVDALRMLDTTVIVSNDKDLQTVPGLLYVPRTKELLLNTPETASCFFLQQMVEGDTADNIPGFPGKGKAWCGKNLRGEDYEHDVEAVKRLYKGRPEEYALEQGRLLFLQREPGQMWEWGQEYDGWGLIPARVNNFYRDFIKQEEEPEEAPTGQGWISSGFLFSGD